MLYSCNRIIGLILRNLSFFWLSKSKINVSSGHVTGCCKHITWVQVNNLTPSSVVVNKHCKLILKHISCVLACIFYFLNNLPGRYNFRLIFKTSPGCITTALNLCFGEFIQIDTFSVSVSKT